LKQAARELKTHPPSSIDKLRGIEGGAGSAYFRAWHSFPLSWKGIGRKTIPDDWRRIQARSSLASGRHRPNRYATHPINAMLNYAYGVLENEVRTHVVAAGLDPTIGYLHGSYKDKHALVYDLMEPLRPVMDRRILEFVQQTVFTPADFTLSSDGLCRLNPQL